MSHVRTSNSKGFNDEGVAITTEYVLLLGVSLMIFSAISIGFTSFYNTSAADSRAQSAAMIAIYVSDRISDISAGDQATVEDIGLPGKMGGDDYVVYPSEDGRNICVLPVHAHSKAYSAPIICKDIIKIDGFLASEPEEHRIAYDPKSKTVTLS